VKSKKAKATRRFPFLPFAFCLDPGPNLFGSGYAGSGRFTGEGRRRLFAALLASVALVGLGFSPLLAQVESEAETALAQEPDEEEATDGLPGMLAEQDLGFYYEIYQVRSGDTVENIAARFGVSADRIRQFNNLTEAELTKGQSLAIPLPGKSGVRKGATPPEPALNLLEPCYAVVTSASAILSVPGDTPGGEVLYEPQLGTQLIVNAERGDYWGIVMVDGSAGWVPKSSLQMTDRKIPPEKLEMMLAGGRPDIVQEARRYLGTAYRYGGSLPYDVDCSLLVQTVYASRGIKLPRTAAQQFEVGRAVHYTEMLPGDRVYFVSRSGRINHTGIYIGNGLFIHASSRRSCVGIDALYDRMYWARFIGARRS
jgi:LysM repeat protein